MLSSPQTSDLLNTAVLTGQLVKVPLQVLAVEADGSVTDVTNSTSCRSSEEDVLKVGQLHHKELEEERGATVPLELMFHCSRCSTGAPDRLKLTR